MRFLGFCFVVVTAGGVLLPDPLGWYLLAVMVVIALVSLATYLADRRVAREVASALETTKHREWTGQLKQMAAEDDAAWDEAMKVVPGLEPLRPLNERPERLRNVTRFPTQRRATPAS